MKKTIITTIALIATFALQAQKIPSWQITDVIGYYNKNSDSVYVINFWATWCKPCVEELPYLQRITEKYADKKVRLILVSLDFASFFPAKIETFVKKQNITTPVVWLNETDADYFCNAIDKKWSGVIPATLIVNSKKNYRQFYEEAFTPETFEDAIKKAL